MKLKAIFVFLMLLVITSLNCMPLLAQNDEVLTNQLILDLYRFGMGETLIITKIKTAKNTFDVSTNGLIQLMKDSLPQPIITAMAEYAAKNRAEAKPDANALPIPDFVNTPMYLDETTNTLKSFERRPINYKEKSVVIAFVSGGQSAKAIAGVTSHIQFEVKHMPRMFVKVNPGTDPASAIMLYPLLVNNAKEQRELMTDKGVNIAGSGNSGGTLANVIVNFKLVSPNVYEIAPEGTIIPGEYGFTNNALSEMYAMRVWLDKSDPSGNTLGPPPPSFDKIKADLMGRTINDWEFNTSTKFEKAEQTDMQQYATQTVYTYSFIVFISQKGIDQKKQMDVRIVYKKNATGQWVIDKAEKI